MKDIFTTVEKMHVGMWYVSDRDKNPVQVGSIHVNPPGCLHHVHINAACYDIGHAVMSTGYNR